jgi:hypothetical protein
MDKVKPGKVSDVSLPALPVKGSAAGPGSQQKARLKGMTDGEVFGLTVIRPSDPNLHLLDVFVDTDGSLTLKYAKEFVEFQGVLIGSRGLMLQPEPIRLLTISSDDGSLRLVNSLFNPTTGWGNTTYLTNKGDNRAAICPGRGDLRLFWDNGHVKCDNPLHLDLRIRPTNDDGSSHRHFTDPSLEPLQVPAGPSISPQPPVVSTTPPGLASSPYQGQHWPGPELPLHPPVVVPPAPIVVPPAPIVAPPPQCMCPPQATCACNGGGQCCPCYPQGLYPSRPIAPIPLPLVAPLPRPPPPQQQQRQQDDPWSDEH